MDTEHVHLQQMRGRYSRTIGSLIVIIFPLNFLHTKCHADPC